MIRAPTLQIALFCLPALVLTGWAFDYNLSLDFRPFEAFALLMTILIVGFSISVRNQRSSWLYLRNDSVVLKGLGVGCHVLRF